MLDINLVREHPEMVPGEYTSLTVTDTAPPMMLNMVLAQLV